MSYYTLNNTMIIGYMRNNSRVGSEKRSAIHKPEKSID
ncbi:MAG: hypothetical protein ACJAZF_004942 [Granulosicoccus sp.]